MAYADFEFYKNEYFGNVVPEADFDRYSEMASREIDSMTNRRLRKWFPDNVDERNDIKWSVCMLADAIYRRDSVVQSGMDGIGTVQEDGSMRGKIITSVTSGSESIGYSAGGTSSSSVDGSALEDSIDIETVKRNVSKKFLSGISYMDKNYSITFRGVGYE